jgi:hypothetical protein
MIKFRCGHCDQKLGVPDEWAGKRIRCNRCKESCLVPHPQIELQTVSHSAPASPATDLSIPEDGDGGGGMTSDLLNLDAGTALPREERHAPIVPKTKVPIPEYRISREGEPAGPGLAVVKGVGKIPLALACSAGCALIAAAIWAGISTASGYSFFILQIGIGWAAGFGIGLVLTDRNVLMGIAAAVIALGGMMTGKLFVANWLILPELNKLAGDQQAFAREMQKEMNEGSVAKALDDNPELIVMVALQELVKTGKVPPATFDAMIQDYLNPTGEDTAIDTEEIGTQIQGLVESWDKETALSKTKEHLPELTRIMFLKAKPKIGFGDAITTTFAYWDLFCIPMGLLWAFRLGNGSET